MHSRIRYSLLDRKLAQYKQKWLILVSRMEDIRYPKQLPDYPPIGRRRRRRRRRMQSTL